jgi:thiamine biosynthesis lipoprotein
VGIQNPGYDRGIILGVLQTYERTVVTSGIYERHFKVNEKMYHHLFDPFTGYPVENGLISVTIISDLPQTIFSKAFSSTDADALSTAIFVLGYEKGKELLDRLPGVEAIFIFEDKSIRVTGDFDFKLTDSTYRLLN